MIGNDILLVSVALNSIIAPTSLQNRRQKVFNRGIYVCSGGLDILEFDKNSTDL